MVSMTDLWKEAGSDKDKTPNDWLNIDASKQLVETVASMLNTAHNGNVDIQVVKTKRGGKGGGGGTWAHKQIALAYAKYLDPKLHVLVNEVFFQRVEEEKNPDLIADRYIKTYKRHGKTDRWIGERFEGKVARNGYTATLAEHGVTGEGYRNCTNAIYEPLFGGGTVVIREKYGIEKGKNIRDNLSVVQLAAIKFSETLAGDDIEKNQRNGNAQCEIASRRASNAVRQALVSHKQCVNA
jgi:hypothetical protein